MSAKSQGLDSLTEEDILLENSQRSLLLYSIDQQDQQGRPLLIELVGQWDCTKLCRSLFMHCIDIFTLSLIKVYVTLLTRYYVPLVIFLQMMV